MKIRLATLFLGTLVSRLHAYDINVTLHNGTQGRSETSPVQVQLLKLEKGMQPVTAKAAAAGRVQFLNLPEMTAGPYMVQASYGGVTYSRVIPPNIPSPAEIKLEVFESTASPDKVKVRTLVELRRTEKESIAGFLILFFVNSGNRTFTAGADGLEFYLPAGAQVGQASISVGSGSSNIQWLKLTPQAGRRPNTYSVGQNVKPGERILQVQFRLPYKEAGTGVAFESLYPQDTGIQLIAEPEDMEVRQGDKLLTRTRDQTLGRGLISFTAREKSVSLRLAGGGIAEIQPAQEEAEIEIRSPLSLEQKILFPLAALLIFTGGIFLKRRFAKNN